MMAAIPLTLVVIHTPPPDGDACELEVYPGSMLVSVHQTIHRKPARGEVWYWDAAAKVVTMAPTDDRVWAVFQGHHRAGARCISPANVPMDRQVLQDLRWGLGSCAD
jgi:hypothetical protein